MQTEKDKMSAFVAWALLFLFLGAMVSVMSLVYAPAVLLRVSMILLGMSIIPLCLRILELKKQLKGMVKSA